MKSRTIYFSSLLFLLFLSFQSYSQIQVKGSFNPTFVEDEDGDSHGDECDNCPLLANYLQADSDNDDIGDKCDCDRYNDLLFTPSDLSVCQNVPLTVGVDMKFESYTWYAIGPAYFVIGSSANVDINHAGDYSFSGISSPASGSCVVNLNFSVSVNNGAQFEICGNNIDDDCDGLVDCDDDDCYNPIEICNNGIDDDCDGFADCEDTDCKDFNNCDSCESLDNVLTEAGYEKIVLDDITISPYVNNGSIVIEEAQIDIVHNGVNINVNDDIISFMNQLGNSLSTLYGRIYSITNCEDLTVLKESGSLTRGPDFESIYTVEVATTFEVNGDKSIWVKIDNTLEDKPSPNSRIFIVPLQNVDIDIQDVWGRVVEHLSNINITNPVVEVREYLDQDELTDGDALSLIGDIASEIIALVRGTYCHTYLEAFDEKNFHDFISSTSTFEQGDYEGRKMLSYVDVSRQNASVLTAFKASSREELTAFFIFHALGHNAGICHNTCKHGVAGTGCGQASGGFMECAWGILWNLGLNSNQNPYSPGWDPFDPYGNLEELIQDTEEYVKDKLKDRFN